MPKSRTAHDDSTPTPAPGAGFEDAMRELEGLVQRMEEGSLTLEQSLQAYQRGAELVKHCQVALEAVRDQVRVLDGEILKPFEPDSGAREADA